MKLSEFKLHLANVDTLQFVLPSGEAIPEHFHVTEIGQINKHFIDCGGKVRNEKSINFQLWEANDFDHRLAPKKLNEIIALSEKVLGVDDGSIEVEYQRDTIGKYGLEFNGHQFLLTSKTTACLASDSCGIPPEKMKIQLKNLSGESKDVCCSPGGTCC